MKKLPYVLLGFILGAFATYYFCPSYKTSETAEIAIVKPKGVIPIDEAKTLNNNWTNHRKAAVDHAAGKVDDRSVKFSVQDIKDYLTYADAEATKLKYDMTGIRIYLGVYSGNAPNGKANYSTMFIVPTGKKSHSTSSMNFLDFSFKGDKDLLIPPLNDGDGGNGGYPQ